MAKFEGSRSRPIYVTPVEAQQPEGVFRGLTPWHIIIVDYDEYEAQNTGTFRTVGEKRIQPIIIEDRRRNKCSCGRCNCNEEE